MRPSIGRIVHYINTPNTSMGEGPRHCAALITDVNPNGSLELIYYPPRRDAVCRSDVMQDEKDKKPGTWHWPEKVD